jgi:lipopolysaccharide assembly protein A
MTNDLLRTTMKRVLTYLGWLTKLLVFLLVLGFALKNSHLVTFVSYLGYTWQAPLIVMLLLAFVLGALTGLLALLPYLFRLRREANLHKRSSEQEAVNPNRPASSSL